MKLDVGYQTDPGPRKGENQDSVRVASLPDQDGILLILSDGMGGARAGEYASRQAVDVIQAELLRKPHLTPDNALERLHEAVIAANDSIFEQAQETPERRGMGCTIVVALVLGEQYWVASVGDSRVYVIRDGQTTQITDDHTWVNARVREGVMTHEEAANSAMRHVLDRALGTRPGVDVDAWPGGPLARGDALLQCLDRRYGVLSDEHIARMAMAFPAQQAAETLVRQALAAHTHDNVSVVVLKAE